MHLIMQTIFLSIYDFFSRHKSIYRFSLVALFVLCAIGASFVRFEQDINKMIPHDPAIEAMNGVLNKTKTGEQIIWTLSFKDTNYLNQDSLITLQQALATQLQTAGGTAIREIKAVMDEGREQQLADLALQYLPLLLTAADYDKIDQLIDPHQLAKTLHRQRQMLLTPTGMVMKQWVAHDPIGMVPLAYQKLQGLQFDPNYELYDGYVFSKDGKRLTFFMELSNASSETGKNARLFAATEQLLDSWNRQQPQLDTRYFGGPAVAAANATQMRQDTLLTLGVTIILLLALTFYVFRRKRAPLLLMIPVLFGGLFGMSVVALWQGSVAIIAVGAGAIILGIAIDFSIHFLSHARHHRNMRENVRGLAQPLTLGAITTIGAFLALRLSNAPLLQDLGLFAAASLTGASLFTLIFLPHLLHYFDKVKRKPEETTGNDIPITFIDRMAAWRPEGNKWLLALVLLATPLLWHYAGKVGFEGDLMKLNYLSPELKAAQDDLNAHNAYALSSVFVVAAGSKAETAARELEQVGPTIDLLQEQGYVQHSINPVVLLPSVAEQQQRLLRWKQYWEGDKIQTTCAAIREQAAQVGFSPGAFAAFEHTLSQEYTIYDTVTTALLQQMMPANLGQSDGQHYAIATLKVSPGSRATVLQAFTPKTEVIATDRQSVAERLLDLLQQDFNRILWISGSLVFLALLIAYGRLELALISFLPMALTWVWILGFMGIFGLKFNVVNIIISTLIFGLGDDYSIFMMDSLMSKYRKGKDNLNSSRSAVYLSVITTIIGLGTLILAQHPALKSIALIAIIGLTCVVFVSQVVQPFLFNFLIQNRADKGFMPFTLWSLVKSAFSFLYFFAGCLLVTICGFMLIGLRPLGKARSKRLFHLILSKYTGSVMYVMANVTKRVINAPAERFDRPAVYIANHSSFLDILLTTMLHPKLVLLTNKWVWRSPVFGKIVRMAEYYPVADGAEDSIEPLRDLVRRGYGIVVFPEGTRSYDDTIHRFHKGAFYIAEQLKLDVVPVVMHGVSYTMEKGDWLLKDGTTTVKLMNPIKWDDARFGRSYSERTRSIARWFRQQFQTEKEANETPKYFREQIVKSHIYKGPVLEWYCRVKTALENNYEHFHPLLPREGLFYDLGCGYGFMTYMLHWSAQGRRFVGVDYDEEKIETAQHHYLREKIRKLHLRQRKKGLHPGGDALPLIHFEQADLSQYVLKPCQGIIISDVLHYLLPEQQRALLDRCYEALLPGGTLIIKDGMVELKARHKGTRRTELFSTRILKFNKTQNELYFLSQSFLKGWAAEKNMNAEVLDYARHTSNLIFVLRKPEV